MSLAGLANVNIELTSRCNKNCHMCGRRERDRIYKDLEYGDMPFEMVEKIAEQIPSGIVVQLHNNGEPLLYPRFGEVANLFKKKGCITSITTNGKLIVKKFDEIVNNLNSISISIFENDPEVDSQFELITKFLELKDNKYNDRNNSTFVVLRFIGNVDESRYKEFLDRPDVIRAKRVLHSPQGSVCYTSPPTVPEFGICVEFLRHLAIDRYGNVSCCVRFDPDGALRLGNINDKSLARMWSGLKRRTMLRLHATGQREKIPFCGKKCHFWGIATSGE